MTPLALTHPGTGEVATLREWARRMGCAHQTLRALLAQGVPLDRALRRKVNHRQGRRTGTVAAKAARTRHVRPKIERPMTLRLDVTPDTITRLATLAERYRAQSGWYISQAEVVRRLLDEALSWAEADKQSNLVGWAGSR